MQADDDKIHEQGNKLKNMESIRKSMSKSNLGIKPIAHQVIRTKAVWCTQRLSSHGNY